MTQLTAYGKFIRKLRIDKNINQIDHANLIGVSTTFLSNVEQGKKPINMQIINKTIDVLDLNNVEQQQLIHAVSQTAPLTIKIQPPNEEAALVTLMFIKLLQNGQLDRAKLKELLVDFHPSHS